MNVIWSPEIIEDIEKLVEYLQNKWPASVLTGFERRLFSKIDLLQTGVLHGRSVTKNPAIRSFFITRHNRLYYEVQNDELYLLRLWDTRQNPSKNPFE